MGLANFEVGDDLIGYVKLESAFGTALKPAAANAFRARSLAFGPVVNRPFPGDRRGTRSRMERTEGRYPVVPWSAQVVFRPSGSLGTPPDVGDLLKLAFGTETINGGVSVVYTLLKDPTALSATIFRTLTTLHELVYGAIVQRLRISWTGSDYVLLDFSGVAKFHGEAGTTTTTTTQTTATTIVSVADADFYTQYGVVKIGTQDSSGAGFLINAAPDYAANTITLEATATWNNGVSVAPFLPAGTFAGDPVYSAGNTTLSLDGGSTTISHLDGFVEIATGLDLLNEEANTNSASDAIMAAPREVNFGFGLLVRKTETYLMRHFFRKVQKDMRAILGASAGKRMQIDMDVCEIDPAPRDIPDTGLARVPLTGVALGTSGEDECSITFN